MQKSLHQNTEALTLNELTTLLTRLWNSKTPGGDLRNTDLFKCSSQEFVIMYLRYLKNRWTGELPENWLKTIIIPVQKRENIKHCENYRRINLVNSDCKIYTNIIKINCTLIRKNKLGLEENRFVIYAIKKVF
jgi:hypothetical protein